MPVRASLQGISGDGLRPWTLVRGRDLAQPRDVLVNENAAMRLGLSPGSRVSVRASCVSRQESLPPITFDVAGVATFPFDAPDAVTLATNLAGLAEACGDQRTGDADLIMVASRDGTGSAAAKAQIMALVPDLRVFTNEELVSRFERSGFSYFRQISTVLTTVTIGFAALLITVLLTVSVNQRLGEIAALRALGFTRGRVVADVLWESVSTTIDRAGQTDHMPRTDEDWKTVRRSAVSLVEATNLLVIGPRRVAPAGDKSEYPGIELEPEQIQKTLLGKQTAQEHGKAVADALNDLRAKAR